MPNTFIDGMMWQDPHPRAPDFIKGKISVKLNQFFRFAEQHQDSRGFVQIDVKQAKNGNIYLALNEYDSKAPRASEGQIEAQAVEVQEEDSEIPF